MTGESGEAASSALPAHGRTSNRGEFSYNRTMRLTATCPRCQSQYQVEESLRGKRMRCPNTICRAVFEVGGASAAEGEKPAEPQPTPPIAEPIVAAPIVAAPIVAMPIASPPGPGAPVARSAPPEPVSWQSAPPPVRSKESPPPTPTPGPSADARPTPDLEGAVAEEPAPAATSNEPAETHGTGESDAAPQPAPPAGPSWQDAPPPVRGRGASSERAAPPRGAPSRRAAPEPSPAPETPQAARGRSLGLIALMFALLAAVGAVGFFQVFRRQAEQEAALFVQAKEAYAKSDYQDARVLLQKLQSHFPNSADLGRYRFLAALSDLRAAAEDGQSDRARALDDVLEFLAINAGDANAKEYGPDLWRVLHRLALDLSAQAEEKKEAGALALARKAWREAGRQPAPSGTALAEIDQKLKAAFGRTEKVFAELEARQRLRTRAEQLARQATLVSIRELRALLAKEKLERDPDFASLLSDAGKNHRQALAYLPADPEDVPERFDPLDAPLAWVTPIGKKQGGPIEGPPLLALAQGVLYALEPGDGRLRWAVRLGPDSAGLPLRIPPDLASPSLVVVASSDRRSILALEEATGALRWERPLAHPALAQPLRFGRRLFVSTQGGRVEELEIGLGRRLGAFALDQNAPWGGTLIPGTSFAAFPGRAFGTYVLDLEKRTVEGVVDSGHLPGSLRGPPIAIPEDSSFPKGPRGWIVLCEQTDANRAALRPFAVPPDSVPPPDLGLSATIDVSNAPWTDGDKLALVSDAGQFALFGIRSKGSADPLVFPWIKELFPIELSASPRHRAMLVHSDIDRYWISTQGRLHRVDHSISPQTGPTLAIRWTQPIPLGSPTQPAEIRRDSNDKPVLFLTCQDAERPLRTVTALDGETGKILWRRQLGATPMQPPIVLGDMVALVDPGGTFWWSRDDLAKRRSEPTHAFPRTAPAEHVTHLFASPSQIVKAAWSPPGSAPALLSWRIFKADGAASENRTVSLPSAVTGTPALDDEALVVPLADGRLMRIALRTGAAITGPEWRSGGADPSATCRLLPLGKNRFLVGDGGDGGDGLVVLDWSDPKDAKRRGDLRLDRRLATSPLATEDGRILVADRGGTAILADGERLTPQQTWRLDALPTAGPFAVGKDFAIVVDRKRLVWLAPESDAPRWERDFDAEIVGAPIRLGDDVVVADLAGRVWRLDPATGDPKEGRPVAVLRGAAAPAVGPILSGGNRVFLILDDGTGQVVDLAAPPP